MPTGVGGSMAYVPVDRLSRRNSSVDLSHKRESIEAHALPGSAPDRLATRMSREEITAITGVITVLRTADSADKRQLYTQLGLRLAH